MKKLTIEFIREKFAERGYTLVSDVYINNRVKLEYLCPKGHEHSIKWNDFSNGHGCPYCVCRAKPTYEQVKSSFEVAGYTLISTVYINNCTKLEFVCDKGHTHAITWELWKIGQRCFYCSGTPKLTYDYVARSFRDRGYILLSSVYNNNSQQLRYSCTVGHVHTMSWKNWSNGYGCPTCKVINQCGSGNSNWNDGISFEKYCQAWSDKEYKREIRARDGDRCLNPCCETDRPHKLHLHHVNYDKKDCHFKNLITICNSCNAKANFDRAWHQSWYQALLHNRYGYNY